MTINQLINLKITGRIEEFKSGIQNIPLNMLLNLYDLTLETSDFTFTNIISNEIRSRTLVLSPEKKELLLTVIEWAVDEMDMDELDSINLLQDIALAIKGLRTIEEV